MLNIGIGMLIVAGFFLIIGLALLYIWKVPNLISEISGKTSKRNIKKLQRVNSGEAEMTNTDLINSLSTGSLESYDKTSSGLSEVLSTVTEDDEPTGRFKRRRYTSTGSLQETSGFIGKEESSSGLATGILTKEEELSVQSVSLDYSEDVSTGYLGEDEDFLGENPSTGTFSSTRTVVITEEYTSLT